MTSSFENSDETSVSIKGNEFCGNEIDINSSERSLYHEASRFVNLKLNDIFSSFSQFVFFTNANQISRKIIPYMAVE